VYSINHSPSLIDAPGTKAFAIPNNKLLRILQKLPRYLSCEACTLPIPDLHSLQLQTFVHKFIHHIISCQQLLLIIVQVMEDTAGMIHSETSLNILFISIRIYADTQLNSLTSNLIFTV